VTNPDGKGQAVVARSRRSEQNVPVLKSSFTSTKEHTMSERNANSNADHSADHSSNQIESFWMHAESERQDIMADFYEYEGAYLLQYDDEAPNDDSPAPYSEAKPIQLAPWEELEFLEQLELEQLKNLGLGRSWGGA
jgi:hypothetical protein